MWGVTGGREEEVKTEGGRGRKQEGDGYLARIVPKDTWNRFSSHDFYEIIGMKKKKRETHS